VLSADQKADLDRQVARLAAFAAEKGIKAAKVVAEVGSGLNGHRKGAESRDSVPRCCKAWIRGACAQKRLRIKMLSFSIAIHHGVSSHSHALFAIVHKRLPFGSQDCQRSVVAQRADWLCAVLCKVLDVV